MRMPRCVLGVLLMVHAQAAQEQGEVEWIIFVHGTLGLRQIELRTFLTLFKEDISNTHYQKTIQIMRNDPFLYQNQPIQQEGLRTINLDQQTSGASLFAQLFDQLYRENPLRHDGTITYFTFGWSGLVSSRVRYQEARKFYEALRAHVLEAQVQGIKPRVTLFGYSHGGNVCLNLAAVRTEFFPEDTFEIATLCLLGTPIQRETDYLICEPIFKKIYNIYSFGDRIQKLDCFSFKRFFSRRRFKSNHRFKVPSTLRQIEIRLKDLDRGNWYDRSPGHIELWFFGWPEHTGSSYRAHFPFHPLPMALFIPNIIDMIEAAPIPEPNVIIELRPRLQRATMRARYSSKKVVVDFMPHEKLNGLRERARSYKPAQCTGELYQAHMQSAKSLSQELKQLRAHQKKALCGA